MTMISSLARTAGIDFLHTITVAQSTADARSVDVTVQFLSYQKRTKFSITFSSAAWSDAATTPTHTLHVERGVFTQATVDGIASKCRTDK